MLLGELRAGDPAVTTTPLDETLATRDPSVKALVDPEADPEVVFVSDTFNEAVSDVWRLKRVWSIAEI